MAHINLLPWREAQRKQKRQDFFTVVGIAAALMLAVVGSVHMYMASLIENQISRNNTLKNEITQVEKKIEEIKTLEKQKDQLIARMRVIEELQSNRPAVVHLFDELARIVPEGLYIETLDQKGTTISIKGKAQSNARVSAFMRALEESDWFKKPALNEINTKSSGSTKNREFSLTVLQDSPKVEQNSQRGGKK